MARRKKNSLNPITLIGGLIVAWGVIQIASDSLRGDAVALTFVFGFAALVIVIVFVIPSVRRNTVLGLVDAITDEHIDALVRQRTMQIRSDPYGKPILDKWHSEVGYFISHHVKPKLRPSQRQLLDGQRTAIVQRISQRVANAAQQRPMLMAVSENMAPAEFEAFCAETLRACGWDVRQTPLSRDQGVDVIAEKQGVRVVLQCKLYSNPVGNKAVQEVTAGKVHQQAHYGAVVTNCTYTQPAKELAATNGIRLLHHTDLPQLEQLLRPQAVQLGLDWN
jgi:restriction system protein